MYHSQYLKKQSMVKSPLYEMRKNSNVRCYCTHPFKPIVVCLCLQQGWMGNIQWDASRYSTVHNKTTMPGNNFLHGKNLLVPQKGVSRSISTNCERGSKKPLKIFAQKEELNTMACVSNILPHTNTLKSEQLRKVRNFVFHLQSW